MNAGVFVYRGVIVMFHDIDDSVKMVMQGKNIEGADFYDAYQLTIEYIDSTLGYYEKHGTN